MTFVALIQKYVFLWQFYGCPLPKNILASFNTPTQTQTLYTPVVNSVSVHGSCKARLFCVQKRQKSLSSFWQHIFNNEIQTLALKAKGQIRQTNEQYTCSNTFFKGVGGLLYIFLGYWVSSCLACRNARLQIRFKVSPAVTSVCDWSF